MLQAHQFYSFLGFYGAVSTCEFLWILSFRGIGQSVCSIPVTCVWLRPIVSAVKHRRSPTCSLRPSLPNTLSTPRSERQSFSNSCSRIHSTFLRLSLLNVMTQSSGEIYYIFECNTSVVVKLFKYYLWSNVNIYIPPWHIDISFLTSLKRAYQHHLLLILSTYRVVLHPSYLQKVSLVWSYF